MFDFITMVGIPGSGKSTLAKNHARYFGGHIVSSDEIRKELYGDENIQGDANEVFDLVRNRIVALLNANEPVIFDATNLKSKHRRSLLNFIKDKVKTPIEKICVILGTPIDICKQRQSLRARKVPLEVIDHMIKSFQFPYYNEGWDKIVVSHGQGEILNSTSLSHLTKAACSLNQDNPHHTYTVGNHCYITSKLAKAMTEDEKMSKILGTAAEYHDYGKLYTKVLKDGIAHYYNHENYSAYLWACDPFYATTLPEKVWALIGFLIQNHMVLYNFKTEEEFQKWGKKNSLTKEELFLLSCLHRADKEAK